MRALGGLDVARLRGVEVGPLFRPLIAKSESEVFYVDHCSAEELRKKYEGDPKVDHDAIVTIDFIWKDEPLADLVSPILPLDYVVASHVIEHVPDLVGWLLEMRDALRDGGRLVLVVPDKRFTFDVHRRTSSLAEISAAFAERRRRPGLRCIMDHFANVVSADTPRLWEDYEVVDGLQFYHGPEFLELAQRHFAEGRYVDVHAWVFTPWSFLATLGYVTREFGVGFSLCHFLTTQQHDLEFYVQLERTDVSRTDWASAAEAARSGAVWPSKARRAIELAG